MEVFGGEGALSGAGGSRCCALWWRGKGVDEDCGSEDCGATCRSTENYDSSFSVAKPSSSLFLFFFFFFVPLLKLLKLKFLHQRRARRSCFTESRIDYSSVSPWRDFILSVHGVTRARGPVRCLKIRHAFMAARKRGAFVCRKYRASLKLAIEKKVQGTTGDLQISKYRRKPGKNLRA